MNENDLSESASAPVLAQWYADPPTPMILVGDGPAPGAIVFIHPTCSQVDGGLRYPVALPVLTSAIDQPEGGAFCYSSYMLNGELHYHPLHAEINFEILAPDQASFAIKYMAEITFVEKMWQQVVDLTDVVMLNIVVAMRHTRYTNEDGPAFRLWINDYLDAFTKFHDMIEFHSSGLRLSWTFNNDFPPLMQ